MAFHVLMLHKSIDDQGNTYVGFYRAQHK